MIVKTGVVLVKRNEPSTSFLVDDYKHMGAHASIYPGPPTVYGDLHVVGNCAVLYYPPTQVPWGTSHGWIDLDYGNECFQRDTQPFRILVLPAHRVIMRRGAMHPFDAHRLIHAGGRLDDTPGELG